MKTQCICLAFVIALVCPYASGQWMKTNWPGGGSVYCIAVRDSNLFAATWGGLFLSTNNGTSWTEVNNGLTNPSVWSLAVSGTNLFAGSHFYGVFLSTSNGISWTEVNNGLMNHEVETLAVLDSNLFAGTGGSGVFLSTNNGASWTATGLRYGAVNAFAVSGTNLFSATILGPRIFDVFLSTDNGRSWTSVNNPWSTKTYVGAFAVSGANLFVGTGVGVFLSTNNGASWTAVNNGLTDSVVSSFGVSGTNLFAGTSTGVWRRPLSEMTTNVESNQLLPTQFALAQNYPNPFNPTTVISYRLPVVSNVKLAVYDILGREVSVLVNERKNSGSYEVKFDAAGLSSGVYLYRLQAGDFVQSRKLVLLR